MSSHHLLSLAVLWVHIAAMAIILGGAVLLWALSCRSPSDDRSGDRPDLLLFIARRYEWLFWAAMGTLVMTGVGNLGAFGAGLPGRDTAWGGTLAAKLLAVLLFVVLSLVRTFVVARLSAVRSLAAVTDRSIQVAYAGTALFTAGIAGLGVLLANS